MAFECTTTNEHKCTSFTALLHMQPLYQQCKKQIDYVNPSNSEIKKKKKKLTVECFTPLKNVFELNLK